MQLWKPSFQWSNLVELQENSQHRKISILYNIDNSFRPVQVTLHEKAIATFSSEFDLHSFPFDQQVLQMNYLNFASIGTGLSSNTYGRGIININPGFYTNQFWYSSDVGKKNLVSGWKIEGNIDSQGDWYPNEVTHEYQKSNIGSMLKSWFNCGSNFLVDEGEGPSIDEMNKKFLELYEDDESTSFSRWTQLRSSLCEIDMVTSSTHISRISNYFIFKVIVPIIIILMVCWSVFWIASNQVETRVTITVVCFLSLIAYNFVIAEELPKLPYLTLMDYIILISYFYAAFPTIASLISHRVHLRTEERYIKFDKYLRIIGPASYLILIYFVITIITSKNIDNSSDALKALTFN
tara:strand:- start:1085 stop:2137 length:1053 start_codon:yes stop_codon:yes gene_type:complete